MVEIRSVELYTRKMRTGYKICKLPKKSPCKAIEALSNHSFHAQEHTAQEIFRKITIAAYYQITHCSIWNTYFTAYQTQQPDFLIDYKQKE